MPPEPITSLDDPRVAPYRDLKNRAARGESVFVTEGRTLTRRLLDSRFEVQSVLVALQAVEEFNPLARQRAVPLYQADDTLLRELVGFPFHLGVLGCASRGPRRPLTDLAPRLDAGGPMTLIVCPHTASRENLGSVFRSAGAFGADAVLLGPACCDVFSRRCLRCSMGAVLSVPAIEPDDLAGDLNTLRTRWGFELWAAVLDERAELLSSHKRPARVALLLGNEFEGLQAEWLDRCDRRVTVPMHGRIDSLNAAVAAGIFLYELRGRT